MAIEMKDQIQAKQSFTREQYIQAKAFLMEVDPANEKDTVLLSIAAWYAERAFITPGQVGVVLAKMDAAAVDNDNAAALKARFANAGLVTTDFLNQ